MEFPKKKWVRVKVRNTAFLGYAYVDSMAGPSVKGRGIRFPITQEQIEKVINNPNATLRAHGFEIEELREDEVRELGLPCPPDWYKQFFENHET